MTNQHYLINGQRLKPYTFAIRTSQRCNQKLQKSMSLPTLTERKTKSTTAQQRTELKNKQF